MRLVSLSLALLMALLIISAGGGPAWAQWIGQEIEDPFGTDNIVGAATMKFGKGLIVRCIGGKRRELMFLPNEKGDTSAASLANTLGVHVLVRIDRTPVVTLDGVMHSSAGKLAVVADIAEELARKIVDAKRRIAVAMETMGQKFGTVSFGVRGSGRHVRKVIAACHQAPSPSEARMALVDALGAEEAVAEVRQMDRIPGAKQSYVVRLKRRVTKADLERMARKLKRRDPDYERIFIEYLLPGMEYGAGAWATSHWTPKLDISILGLTVEQGVKHAAVRKARGKGVVGTWRLDYSLMSGVLVIRKTGNGRYVSEWTFAKNGQVAKGELERVVKGRQVRFVEKSNGYGEYWVLLPNGDIESWDRDGRTFTAKAIR